LFSFHALGSGKFSVTSSRYPRGKTGSRLWKFLGLRFLEGLGKVNPEYKLMKAIKLTFLSLTEELVFPKQNWLSSSSLLVGWDF
jgi:hypothetical protein